MKFCDWVRICFALRVGYRMCCNVKRHATCVCLICKNSQQHRKCVYSFISELRVLFVVANDAARHDALCQRILSVSAFVMIEPGNTRTQTARSLGARHDGVISSSGSVAMGQYRYIHKDVRSWCKSVLHASTKRGGTVLRKSV